MNNILEQVSQILNRPTDEQKRAVAEAYRRYYEEYNAEMIQTLNPIPFIDWLKNKEKEMRQNEKTYNETNN